MKPSRIRAHSGALGATALFCAFLAVLLAGFPAAAHAAPTLALPSFQELITKSLQPAASAPQPAPASAAAPVSDADLGRSLDTLITTLDSDKQRAALVAQLKTLRDARHDADADA